MLNIDSHANFNRHIDIKFSDHIMLIHGFVLSA